MKERQGKKRRRNNKEVKQKEKNEEKESDEDWSIFEEWWGKICGTVLLGGLGWYFHHAFTKLEAGGEGFRAHWLIILLYKWLGKWGVTGVLGSAAVIFFIVAIIQLVSSKKDD